MPPAVRRLAFAGADAPAPVQTRVGGDFWFRGDAAAGAAIKALAGHVAPALAGLSAEALLQLDYLMARDDVIPAYLGGASGLCALGG